MSLYRGDRVQLLRDVRRRASQDAAFRQQVARLLLSSSSQFTHSSDTSGVADDDEEDDDDADEDEDDDVVDALIEHVSELLSPVVNNVPSISFSITERVERRDQQSVVIVVFNLVRVRDVPTLPPSCEWRDWSIEFQWMQVDPPSLLSDDLGALPVLSPHALGVLKPIVHAAQRRFHRHSSNVVGVLAGYSPDRASSGWTNAPALLVVVHHKGFVPLGESPLPRRFKGVPVHVFEGRCVAGMPPRIQEIEHDDPRGTIRLVDPIRSGASIGILGRGAVGTLGGFIVDSRSGTIYLLTNAHVVQDAITADVADNNNASNNDSNTNIITQPSGPDKIRDALRTLQQNLNGLVENRAPKAEQEHVRQQMTRVRAGAPWPMTDDGRYVVAVRPTVHKRGDKQVRRAGDATRSSVGVDMALCEYTGNRLVDVRIAIPSDLEAAQQTHAIGRWDSGCDEEHDLVVKDGRSTGLTMGRPTPMTASVNPQQLGVHLLLRGDQPNTVHYQLRALAPTLHNQYLVKHERSSHRFAFEGDSGSLCYLHDHNQAWELRPWGLFHSVLATNAWAYAVVSPMEAVMACAPPGCTLLSPQNQHLLGQRVYTDEDDGWDVG